MKIALVHDYLTQLGGAEKVLKSFHRLYPDSPIFVLLFNKNKLKNEFKSELIITSWLQYMPFAINRHQWYLTFMPLAIESFDLSSYQAVLSSASSIAKGVKTPAHIPHICYCHTPTRYLWHDAERYIEELNYHKLIKKIVPLFLPRIKNWDWLAAQKVDYFIANSKTVQERIKKYYQRESKLIYPPVETKRFYISQKIEDYYLAGGRLVAYKRYDLIVQTFNKLGLKLKIFGQGPEYKRLKKWAKSNIKFLGAVNEEEKAKLFSRAIAFINPQVEDFGITTVEAMAAGRPVIAFRAGGALETVEAGKTGEFFEEQSWECLAYQLIHFQPEKYNPQYIKARAEQFNVERFERQIKEFVDRAIKDFQNKINKKC